MGKSRARNPTQNPSQKPTPNRPEPSRTMQRLRTAPCPQALRSARDAWRAHGPSSEETAGSMVLISEIKKKNQNPKLSNSLNRSLRSTHTQDLLPTRPPTTQHHHTHEPTHAHPQPPGGGIEHPEQKWPLYSTSSSSESSDTKFFATIELKILAKKTLTF